MTDRTISQRQACRLISVVRSVLKYVSPREAKVELAVGTMKQLSEMNPRCGFRQIRIVLDREGQATSPSRAERLWRKAKL